MDQRIAEIINPVIEDMGFELVRIRLMGGQTKTLQIMADKPKAIQDVTTEQANLTERIYCLEDVLGEEIVDSYFSRTEKLSSDWFTIGSNYNQKKIQ